MAAPNPDAAAVLPARGHDLEAFIIREQDIIIGSEIAKGCFGVVHNGTLTVVAKVSC